ncbi:ABC transporter substrate-binding protein [Nonomuraea sp. NPDC050556]|uniref:ABC transporter substrate-binding protein n=1 Tax=Nonomuraea sp. NPDC050556 TaxID=3364369 RepID=UPI0037AA9B23
MANAISRRNFLAGTSVLFVAGAATACGSSDDGKDSAARGTKITLSQWYHAYGEAGTQQAVQRYAAAYTKANPDVAIKISWIAGDYETRLNSALLSSSAPDLFEIGDFRASNVKSGLLAPLDDIIGPVRSDYARSALDTATVDGKVYGVKMMDDVMMLYYRKSVLDKAGIVPPRTFTELLAAAKSLTSGKQKGLFIGSDGVGDVPYLLLWSSGGDLVDPSGRTVTFNTPEAAAAIGALKDLNSSGTLLQGFTTDWFDPGALVQGAAAMHWCGLWAMPDIKKKLGDDFGVVPWPAFGGSGSPAVRVGGWYHLVNGKGPHVDAAKKYANWLWIQQADLQKDWCVSYGFHVPSRKSVAAQTTPFSSGPAQETVALSQQYGHSFPPVWNKATTTAFIQSCAKIAKGKADVAAELADAAKACQAELDKQNA